MSIPAPAFFERVYCIVVAHALEVRGWAHDLNVAAILAGQHGRGRKACMFELRRAATRHLHFVAGCPVATVQAQVTETRAGIRREAAARGDTPAKKATATKPGAAGEHRDVRDFCRKGQP